MKLSRAIATGVAVTAALLGGGAAYAATASTPTASATDTIVTTATSKYIGTTGGVWTTIATLKLPPGKFFVLHAAGDMVNYGPSDYTRCQIWVAGTPIAGVSTVAGNPPGTVGPAALLSPFAVVGGTVNTTSSTELASLNCEHDHSNGANPYVDADATLWAHQTNGLTLARE